MTAMQTAAGAAQLAAILNLNELIPSTKTIQALLTTIAENNIKLDKAQHEALRELIVKTGEMTGSLDDVLTRSLEGAFKSVDERNHGQLLEVIHGIDQLESVNADDKAVLLHNAVSGLIEARRAEIEGHADVKRILASMGGGSLLALTVAVAYKHARKKSFWETAFRLVG